MQGNRKNTPVKVVPNRELIKTTLVDMGFGEGEFLRRIAAKVKDKRKRFLGIELNAEEHDGTPTRQHNLKLVFGGALEKIRRLESRSVGFFTANFLFNQFTNQAYDNTGLRFDSL